MPRTSAWIVAGDDLCRKHHSCRATIHAVTYGDSDTPPHLVAFYDHAGDTEVQEKVKIYILAKKFPDIHKNIDYWYVLYNYSPDNQHFDAFFKFLSE